MHLFLLVLDRVVNLYQLTASSYAGSYYRSHMHYFASFHVYQFSSLFSGRKLVMHLYLYPRKVMPCTTNISVFKN